MAKGFSLTRLIWIICILISAQIVSSGYPTGTSPCSIYSGCDPRCLNSYCTSPTAVTNLDCCNGCAAPSGGVYYYFWQDGRTCAQYCPAGQYPVNATNNYCDVCDSRCLTCTGASNTVCQSCNYFAYSAGSNQCWANNWISASSTTNGNNPCRNPYYGLQITMTCINCPTGCSACYLYLTWEMPSSVFGSTYDMAGLNCPGDATCSYNLYCTSCSSGYTNINGFCLSNTQQCFTYSKSNSTSITFDPATCACFPNYYSIGLTICSKCPITCLTCSGSTCSSCPTFMTGTTSCSFNSSFDVLVNQASGISSGTFTTANSVGKSVSNSAHPVRLNSTNCAASTYYFGYYGYDLDTGNSLFPDGATLIYDLASYTNAHYGIKVRATLLFIDLWYNNMSILFSSGTGSSKINAMQFNYQMEEVAGEYLCGRNYHDHLDVADGWFKHNETSIHLEVKANVNGMAWGIKQIMVIGLKCDPTCKYCTGSLNSQCSVCDSTLHKILVNGYCVCDYVNGYFMSGSTCTANCGSLYGNPVTFTCTATCTFPYLFAYYNTGTTAWTCKINCPSGYYKYYGNYTCMSSCFDSSVAVASNYYRFDGSDDACYQTCPTGTYGDPTTGYCVAVCPTFNSSTIDGYFSLNGYCYTACSATTYAYNFTRSCVSSCPAGQYKNTRVVGGVTQNICEQRCSQVLGGQYLYGDNSTGWCTNTCAAGTYGDIATFKCVTYCNSSAYAQNISGTRTCVIDCSVANGLYGNPQTGLCVTALQCPTNFYGDPLTSDCTKTCSGSTYFGDNVTKLCQTAACSNGGFRQNLTKICVKTCSVNNSVTQEWGDTINGYCVSACTGNYFADAQFNYQCVLTCASSPAATFGQNYKCVYNCSNTTWADPYHPNRICTTSCTNNGVNDTYGRNDTRMCVKTCPDSQFALNVSSVPLCVFGCTQNSGLFGDITTNRCKDKCPSPFYGDQTGNRTCVKRCPWPYYAQNCSTVGGTIVISTDRVCRLDCSLCGWADNSSQTCAWDSSGCYYSTNPLTTTFAHQNNHQCVISTGCVGFGDPLTRYCISPCFASSSVKYYGDPSTKLCVLICPDSPNYFGDNTTSQCVSSCTTGTEVRDPQYKRRCVLLNLCSRTPVALYGDDAKDLCVTALNCTAEKFGDNNTNICSSTCAGPTLRYSDNVTRQCVNQCQLGWYAYNTSGGFGVCTPWCPIPLWADNYTVICTPRCSALSYGVNYTDATGKWVYSLLTYNYGVCQSTCPLESDTTLGQFARDSDNLCVTNCGAGKWGDRISRTCKTAMADCPDGYYADNVKNLCVLPSQCSVVGGVQYVADNLTKSCVNKCPTSVHNFADMVKFLCVAICPINYFGYNSTLQCVPQCRLPVGGIYDVSGAYDGSFADPQLRICVQICSSAPISTFGENITYTCVQARYCPDLTWAEVLVYNRQCRPHCPGPVAVNSYTQMYADNITKSCVSICPLYSFADLSTGYGLCVFVCPELNNGSKQYSDNSTKTCVLVCPATNSTWGDNTTRRCVAVCPLGSYAQLTPYRYCVAVCAADTWGEDVTRTCVYSPLLCPIVNGSLYYAYNTTHMCVKQCPSNESLWGQNVTRLCLADCIIPTSGLQSGFKWNSTRVCIDICPAQIGVDGSYSDQGMCYFVCMTAAYYRDPQANRSCQNNCTFSPTKQYADSTTMRCVALCPTYPIQYYSYDVTKTCESSCPFPTKRLDSIKHCVTTCPSNSFYNVDTNQCLEDCSLQTSGAQKLYGNPVLDAYGEGTCVTGVNCPSTYYADDNVNLCVTACTDGQWIYGKYCLYICPDGYYGNPSSLTCVVPLSCPTNYYADNVTQTCVSQCSGSFADKINQVCVDVCASPYFANPPTRACQSSCTSNSTIDLIQNTQNRTCVAACGNQLWYDPFLDQCKITCSNSYYADNSTRSCVSVCPSAPPLYGQNATYRCVQHCLVSTEYKYEPGRVCVTVCPAPNYFRDNITRSCIQNCLNTTYANIYNGYCVVDCNPYYAYQEDNTCVTGCPSPYYRDPTTYKCVQFCPNSPTAYYRIVTLTDRYCGTSCPGGQFRDFSTSTCVTACPLSPVTYSDTTSGNCVTVCSVNYYALNSSRTCVTSCPVGMFADPLTRSCVSQCSPKQGLFGDPNIAIPKCVSLCKSGSFADQTTYTCVTSCGGNPRTYGFDNGTSRVCLYSCPYPYVADNSTGRCLTFCDAALPYIDQASQLCVSKCTSPVYQFSYMPSGSVVNGTCVKFCPNGFFALLTNNSCVEVCPSNYYGDTKNNTCMKNCTLSNNRYADDTNNLCVAVCSHNDSYNSFADQFSRKCVTSCPVDKQTIADLNIWKCVPRCTLITQFADPTTGTCVSSCPSPYFADLVTQTCILLCNVSTLTFGYLGNNTCVSMCPLPTLYANYDNRMCVTSVNCPSGYFGLNSTRVCVKQCPTTPDLFGYQDNFTKVCVSTCPSNYFADFNSRTCVLLCPAVPSLFAENNTIKCVKQCPSGSFADNQTRQCIQTCSASPIQTFADDTTNRCVVKCPAQPNYFASNLTWECISQCSISPPMYADYSTRSCVYYCPSGGNLTFADESTRSCVKVCPGSTYMQNTTQQCLTNCITGYADPLSKFCVAKCRNYTYGNNNTMTCGYTCPIVNFVQWYAEDTNNQCMSSCLQAFGTFRDPSTNRCVKICPISQGFFAEPNQRLCMSVCPISPLLFADFSTRYCVPVCPQIPALFALSTSNRVCAANCINGTWADNITRTCLTLCNTSPQSFGDNSTWTCVGVHSCPGFTYSDNSTWLCVFTCPSVPDYYADNTTKRCVFYCPNGTFADPTSHKCVTTCPEGYFGRNDTLRCVTACPWKSFADDLINLCVAKCTIDPIFYGNPDTLICVSVCPASNYSFGNPLTQECVDYQLNGTSGCPQTYFADNYSRLCTQVCPMSQDTYGDNSTWKCVDVCPIADATYSDNSTMRCVKICPSYPEYYAEIYSRRCVHFCLKPNDSFSGTFSDNSTRLCVHTCPSSPDYYSDNSTGRCVFYCPEKPLTFADYSTRRCVSICPSSPDIYGDMKTLRCVLQCPRDQWTFADYTTRLCVKTCPLSPPLYAQNGTLRCLAGCPNNSYADNSTRKCVAVCPRYPQTYSDPSTNLCVIKCPASPPLYAYPGPQTCVVRCPSDLYGQNTTRRCLQQCPPNLVNWADNQTNLCVARCPASQLTYGDNSTQKCVLQCPFDQFTFADNLTRVCLASCQNVTGGGFADNFTRVCVAVCPGRSYADITTRTCVRYCPPQWYSYNMTNQCLASCPAPYFGDNSTWACVLKCPVSQNFFGQNINRTCTPHCPEGTYASAENQQCVIRCPNSSQTLLGYSTFGYNDTNECLEQCPYPLYGYPVAQVCVDICPDPYYMNVTDHLCYLCPLECASCNNPLRCLTCNPDHYLYSGACVQSCPTFPVIMYANPNRICGTAVQCTQGFFALNTTKSCVANCPSGFFKNNDLQTCDACSKGCTYCLNAAQCITCDSTRSTWSNYKCYLFCSALKRFYFTTGCVSICPKGYYLNLTTCLACSTTCLTCVVSAENCLVCASGYYISNSLCVSSCPVNTKAASINGSLKCQSCQNVDCTTKPLTYTVSQFVDNYKYNVQLQFSQPVNITKEIDKVIQIQQVNKKRLLVTTFKYLDYTIYDYGNGLYSFVLNNYNPASNSQIQVQILNPAAIQSQGGSLPTVTRSQLSVDISSLYSLDNYNKSFDSYVQFIVLTAFVLLIASFWTEHSIWMPMYDLMQFLMILVFVNVNYPPNLLYIFQKLLGAGFNFLPNFFKNAFSAPAFDSQILNNNIYSIMKEGAFLRVFGCIYFILLMTGIVLLTIYILSKKNPSKEFKKWCKQFIRETFWKKHVQGLIFLLFLPVFTWSIFNMREYRILKGALQGFSIFSSFLFMFTFLGVIIYYIYVLKKFIKDHPLTYLMMRKAYNFITFQPKVVLQNKNHYFEHQKNQIDITDARRPRINGLLVLPFPVQTKFGPADLLFPIINYGYKFLAAIFVSLIFSNPIIQILSIMLLTIAFLVYILVRRPFFRIGRRQFNNQVYSHNLIVLIIVELILLIFSFLYTDLDMNSKVLIGNLICGVIIYGITVNLAYFIYRVYLHYYQKYWKKIVRSEFFKLNYTVEHLEWTKQYQKSQHQIQSKLKSRAEFLQSIKVETGEALANFVNEMSVSGSTKDKIKALKLRPTKTEIVEKQFGSLFTNIANEKQKSHKSIQSSQRLSKKDRVKVRDLIFGEKQENVDDKNRYQQLELIDQKSQEEGKSKVDGSEEDEKTEYEYEYIQEEYPEGTSMEEIMKGCKKGDIILPL